MSSRDHLRAGLAAGSALLFLLLSVVGSAAQSLGSNGLYDVAVDTHGEFTARTGPVHPGPVGANVLYNGDVLLPRTSFNSVRSYGTGTEYALRETLPGASPGFTCRRIASIAAAVIEPINDGTRDTGVRHTWSIANGEDLFDIVQEVNAEGAAFDDSVVRITLCLQNQGATALEAGVRYLWDWQIGEQDGAYVGLHPPSPPAEPYLDTEMDWAPPGFTFYEASDQQSPSVTPPLYRIGGTVNGPALDPPPSPPELLQFISWPASYPTCFQATTADRVIGADDSAIAYYWGATPGTALVVAPGESLCLTQYLFAYADRPPALCDLVAALAGGGACAPGPVTLDASGSEGPDCAGALEFRFLDPEGRTARDWSTDPSAEADVGGTWTVEVRCSDDPGCTASDSAEVVITDVAAALAGGAACGSEVVTLDASASTATGCPGGLEYRFLDPSGAVARDWSPDPSAPAEASGSWTVEARCSDRPDCASTDAAGVVIEEAPAAFAVLATDLDPCNPGLLLEWPADWEGAAWGTNGPGTFAVHRSELSCEDALARPPIASGLSEPRHVDRTGLDGQPYWYAVLAEAGLAAEGCPGGPERGAPFATACLGAPATDLVVPPPPESIGSALRVRRPDAAPVLEWTLGPELRPFESDLLRRSLDDPQALTLHADGLLGRTWEDAAAEGALLFYKVYRSNGCGDVSED